MDILSIVNNVQQASPEELAVSQEKAATSTRFILTGPIDIADSCSIHVFVMIYVLQKSSVIFHSSIPMQSVEFWKLWKMY